MVKHDAHDVPPRKGHRVKVNILPSFNQGMAFRLVKHVATNKYYSVHGTGLQQVRVWDGPFRTIVLPADELVFCKLPPPPTEAYEETTATIGGIGKHLRWSMPALQAHVRGAVDVFVANISNADDFMAWIPSLRPFALWPSDEQIDNGATIVRIVDASYTMQMLSHLHVRGYGAVIADESQERTFKLGIERFDRSDHMWWSQSDKACAGPLRDVHRWHYAWLPTEWTTVPFTWQAMARYADTLEYSDVERSDVQRLPQPLRNHVVASHSASPLDLLRAPCVTSRLTPESATAHSGVLAAHGSAGQGSRGACAGDLSRVRTIWIHGARDRYVQTRRGHTSEVARVCESSTTWRRVNANAAHASDDTRRRTDA